MVKVRATQKCFIDNVLRDVGEVFNVGDDDVSGSAPFITLEQEEPRDVPVKPPKKKAKKEQGDK